MASSLRQKNAPTGADYAEGGQDTLGTSDIPWKHLHTVDITAKGDVVIQGDLQVVGDATQVNVDQLSVDESMIRLAKVNTGDTADIGLVGAEDTDGTPVYLGFVRDADNDQWKTFENLNSDPLSGTTVDFSSSSLGTINSKFVTPESGLTIGSTAVTSTAAEINKLDRIENDGVAEASKAVILDENKDLTGMRDLTITGTVTAASITAGSIVIEGNSITTASGAAPSFSEVEITGGTIDATVIGGTTAAAGNFTTLDASDAVTLNANVTLGDNATDELTFTGRLVSDVLPLADSLRSLGSDTLRWAHTYSDEITASTIHAFTAGGAINFNNQAMTQVDINSGVIDNVVIGGQTAVDATFETLSTTDVGTDLIPDTDSTHDLGSTGSAWAEAHVDTLYASTIDLDGSSIKVGATEVATADENTFTFKNSVTISSGETLNLTGATLTLDDGEIAAGKISQGTFATGTYSFAASTISSLQALTVDGLASLEGNVDLGSDANDTLSVNAKVDTNVVPATGALDLGTSSDTWAELHVDKAFSQEITSPDTSTDLKITAQSGKAVLIRSENTEGIRLQYAPNQEAQPGAELGYSDVLVINGDATPEIIAKKPLHLEGDLKFVNAQELLIKDADASSLIIKDSAETGALSYMTIDTSNEKITFHQDLDLSAATLTLSDDAIPAAAVTGLDGAGLADSAGVLSVNVDNTGIEINSDTLRLKDSGVAEAKIANDAVTNDKLANITRGSVKVGGENDAPTDLAAGATGQILVGDGTDINSVAVSGDATLASNGALTITDNAITLDKLASLTGAYFILGDSNNDPAAQALSGDISVDNAGVVSISSGVIVNADINANAAIVDTKLATISTADKVSGSAVQLAATSAIEDATGLKLKDALAGAGLGITGQVLSVNVDDSSIEISNDTLQVKALGVTNAMLAGSIANAKLVNDHISISAATITSEIDLGSTITYAAGNGIDVSIDGSTVTYSAQLASDSNQGVAQFSSDDFNVTAGAVTVKDLGVSNDQLAGSIANSKLVNSSVNLAIGSGLTGSASVALGATASIDLSLDSTLTTVDGDLTIADNAVNLARLQQISQDQVFGRTATGTGSVELLSIGTHIQAYDAKLQTLSDSMGATAASSLAALTSDEIFVLDGATEGTAVASKALVVDASKDIDSLNEVTAVKFTDGIASLTSGNLTGLAKVVVDNIELDTNTIKSNSGDLTLDAASGSLYINYGDNLTIRQNTFDGTGGSVDIEGTLSTDAVRRNVILKTANYTFDNSDVPNDHIVLFDATSAGGNLTFTLPAANDSNMTFRECIVKNVGTSNSIVVSSTSDIDAVSTTLAPGDILKVVSTTTKWCQI